MDERCICTLILTMWLDVVFVDWSVEGLADTVVGWLAGLLLGLGQLMVSIRKLSLSFRPCLGGPRVLRKGIIGAFCL